LPFAFSINCIQYEYKRTQPQGQLEVGSGAIQEKVEEVSEAAASTWIQQRAFLNPES
jgi:hypothetical protein